METAEAPLAARERKQLEGYVAPSTALFRIGLIGLPVLITALAAWKAQSLFRRELPPVWTVPPLLLAGFFFFRAHRWTGGSAFRKDVRADLEAGVALVRDVTIEEAVEVEEREDEGRTYILKTSAGETIVFAGQYLDRYAARGFPWRRFEIREAPRSKVFFGLRKLDDARAPLRTVAPFGPDQEKTLIPSRERWAVLPAAAAELFWNPSAPAR